MCIVALKVGVHGVFLAGKFLFVPFTVLCSLANKRTEINEWKKFKREREFFKDRQSGVHWSTLPYLI